MSGSSSSTCGEPLDAADQVGALDERRGVLRVEHQVAAHARGGVDDDVDVGVPDPLDDLAVERDVARALAGLRVAHVDVHDGRRPARAAAMPDSAICSGVTGTCSERPTVSPAPVSAQVMMTLRFMVWTPSSVLGADGVEQGVQAEVAEVAGLAVDQASS